MNQRHPAARRITRTLFAAQCLGSAGFITASTINSIVGAQLSGHPTWAGLPGAVYQLGVAAAAWIWGYGMDRFGRRGGITLGLLLGVLGSGLAAVAVVSQQFGALLVGLALMGATQAALQFGRFVAAEVSPPAQRARAIATVVLGGTVGAIVGPLIVGPLGALMLRLGLPELIGPYFATIALFVIAALVVFALLRPEPRDVGREVARLTPETDRPSGPPRSFGEIVRVPAAAVAMTAMVLGQLTMVMLMVITSLHMRSHEHPLSSISLVISSHTVGMFAFSIISGRLADRLGRAPVIAIGATTLIVACLIAPLSLHVGPIALALFLLGLGWNFCFVGGSTLLADQLSPDERSRTQGTNDFLIGMVSAFGSAGSGVVFATLGYVAMSIVGIAASIAPLVLALWLILRRPSPTIRPQQADVSS